ncbi:MAG: acyl-CoA dehydrogenase family protein [Rhodobacteraceae bacterium]|jgi:alkylation response protein AidB-like acyl-CoA dehydrogenase|nr:acyl-CoA dehydrogenase family protein [Paracoccaceae bacterium]
MIPFAAPVDDILASLDTFAGGDRLPGWDRDMTGAVLDSFAALAEGVIAPLDAVGDAQGCRLDGGRVILPDGFRAAYARLAADGWLGLTAPEAHGGSNMDALTAAAVSEVFSGACHALQMVCGLVPGAIATLMRAGSPDQQARLIPPMVRGDWLATMALTEPGAGSDLARIRTRAVPDGDHWRIDGEKIFISGGDQDLSDGILHLVLARTGEPADGVRGLSLFACPAQGADRNGITVARLEAKLGLHASPTCHLMFDGTQGEIIGAPGGGLAAMFTVMNHARLDVALQGVAHATRAHAIARAHAEARVQGRRADGSDAVLADHADVARMLDDQRAQALAARGMVHVALVEVVRGDRHALADFLTPVCKVWASDAGIRAADTGIQILGGYGYLDDYRIHQTWRDARICAIYEGANGIHARALVTRGLRGDGPDLFDTLIGELTDAATVLALRDRWRAERARITTLPDPTGEAHAFMALTGDLLASAALSRLETARPGTVPPRWLA